MKGLLEFGLFLPDFLTPWFGVSAIVAFIMGWNRIAAALGLYVMIDLFALPMLEPLIAQFPLWVLILILAFLPLYLLHSLIQFVFGKETAGTFTGTWLLRISDAILLTPFRLLRFLLRLVFR